MRNFRLLSVLLLCMAVVFTSCGTWNNTAKGTAIGVGGGAAVGAGVGALAGNTALGSIIGAAVGGTAGALIGKKMDKQKKELEATLPEETTVETINNGEALKVRREEVMEKEKLTDVPLPRVRCVTWLPV